jgi:hypothetical protein
VFWNNQVSTYRAFHPYSVVWIKVSTVAVPFLAQAISNPSSKWCVRQSISRQQGGEVGGVAHAVVLVAIVHQGVHVLGPLGEHL